MSSWNFLVTRRKNRAVKNHISVFSSSKHTQALTELPLASRPAESIFYKSRSKLGQHPSNNGILHHSFLAFWTLVMSLTEIVLLLQENSWNGTTATLYLLLATVGLYLYNRQLVIGRKNARLHLVSSWAIIVTHVFLLFGVMAIVACAKKAQSPINSNTWKFFFVDSAVKQQAFGSMLEPKNVLVFLTPIYFLTLGIAGGWAMAVGLLWNCSPLLFNRPAMVLKAMRRVFVQILQGVVGLSCLLLLLFYWQQHQQQEYETFLPWTSCSGPPPVPFQHKPNIIVLTIDSWRKDTVGTDSMPQTLKWLGEGTHLEWKHHDSCAVQSDQGYVALHYGRTGLKREAIRQYKHSSRIKSWLLQAIRDNGYTMHKVTPEYYSFCWLLMEECDLYTRDYGYQNGYNKTTMRSLPKEAIFGGGGSEIVFDTMEKLLQEQARTNGSPIFVSADLQNLHHPLRYEGRAHLNHSYHHPAISDKEVHLTYSGGIQITEDNKANLVQKLRNRVKNCLLELDDDLAAFLKAAQPYLNNTLLVLTGDHSELLFDTEENFIWHGVNHPIDLQRQVPMFLYGPNSIVSKLQVPVWHCYRSYRCIAFNLGGLGGTTTRPQMEGRIGLSFVLELPPTR